MFAKPNGPPGSRKGHWTRTISTGLALISVCGCASGSGRQHGTLSNLSLASDHDWVACQHQVPAEVCVRCEPARADKFKAHGDWCDAHQLPESQCLACNPDLDFSPPKPPPAQADVAHLGQSGEDVPSLQPHLVAGKITVFDFYASWCPPCRKVDEHLYPQLIERRDIALRKIDVGSWDSPVAERWLKEVPELPYLIVFDAKGHEVARISGAQLEQIDRALQEAKP